MPSHVCSDPTDASGDSVLDVQFEITNRGHAPDTTDPGCPPEFYITSAVDENGTELLHQLAADQQSAIEAEIAGGFDFETHWADERDVALLARAA